MSQKQAGMSGLPGPSWRLAWATLRWGIGGG